MWRGPFPPTLRGRPAAADTAIGCGATAAIAYNDLLGIGMLSRFAERKVSVPGDISVVGFDDIFGADICSPPLTTLAGPFHEVGRLAVDQILGARGARGTGAAEQLILPSHLVIRGSSGPASAP